MGNDQKGDDTVFVFNDHRNQGCVFRKLIEISVWTRLFVAFIMVAGSAYGLFDIGYKTVPNAQYVEVPVYSLGFSEPMLHI